MTGKTPWPKLKRAYREWQNNPHFYVATTPYSGCATCGYGPGAYFHNEYHVRRVAKAKESTFDLRDSAGALFNVFPERVTRAMIKRVRVMFYLLPPDNTLIENVIAPGEVSNTWPDCPNCKQSATGRGWRGIAGCTRCGWSEGGNQSKRNTML